ncbi:MAG TPA: PDZ domain-containing protein [Opitutaceae bacterium]|nr:PDZ domain-containing protein [Opitutaceae bacterium]
MSVVTGRAQEPAEHSLEDVTILPAFSVKGDRMEELGVRFSFTVGIPSSNNSVIVAEVFPNTPAAKAGLRPGERVEKIDGKSVGLGTILSLGFKPEKLQRQLWSQLERGKKSVTLTMEVRAPAAKESRTVTLVLPSPPPHWGSEKWSAPEGRTPAVVKEPGPLAALAREVLDNGIWSGRYDYSGYEWRIVQPSDGRRIWVTQQHGTTEIRLEHRSPVTGQSGFLTSPSGAMESGWCYPPGKKKKLEDADELRAQFEQEIDFWLHRVGRVTGRWPFEALSGETAVISAVSSSLRSSITPTGSSLAGKTTAPRAASFLKLPAATAEQRGLFSDALGKIGLDAECWAFTETSRSPVDDHVTTVRFDPSQPPAESSTLLKVDGKDPKPAYLQQWRKEGHGPLPGLGELPPLASVVDLNDVRIYADETAAIVFELPVKASNADLPAEKFQARFRVNKTSRGFEDFSVKLRESMRVGGVAKVTDAGLEARFQTLDPALAPQPVWLKIGGGVSVLLVKVSRALEVTRTDFKRVSPFEEHDNSEH